MCCNVGTSPDEAARQAALIGIGGRLRGPQRGASPPAMLTSDTPAMLFTLFILFFVVMDDLLPPWKRLEFAKTYQVHSAFGFLAPSSVLATSSNALCY